MKTRPSIRTIAIFLSASISVAAALAACGSSSGNPTPTGTGGATIVGSSATGTPASTTATTGTMTTSTTGGAGGTTTTSTTGGTGGSCTGANDCYACAPSTNEEYLNACNGMTCQVFDVTKLTMLMQDGGLPALPP